MSRYAPRPAAIHYSFGPGPITPAVKWLIIANVAMFLATLIYEPIIVYLGLTPRARRRARSGSGSWRPTCSCTADPSTSCSTCWAIWMFGVELERLWGTRQFVKYYAITGIGAGLDRPGGRTAARSNSETYRSPNDRRIRRAVRPARRLRLLLSRSPAADVLPVPDPREVLRDDRRGDGVSLGAAEPGVRSGAPRRTGDRLSLSARRAAAASPPSSSTAI